MKDTNIQARYDYRKEINQAFEQLVKVIVKYKKIGVKVHLIWMGDIFHGSYKDVFEATAANNLIIRIKQAVDEMYGVMGNHEFSFYKDNPFWTLISEMKSLKVRKMLNRIWQPRGTMDVLNVVDEIVDGEVRFIFNHFGTGVERPQVDGTINIGLFHQDLYAKAIAEDMHITKGMDIFEHAPLYFDKSTVLHGYDYAFFGHMHKLYGQWDYVCDKTEYLTRLWYLASLGRTNHTEVNNLYLERNIPAILVTDGKLVEVQDNKFNLMTREECVNEESVVVNQEIRKKTIEKKEFATYVPVVDDPIENIRIGLMQQPAFLTLFDELLGNSHSNAELEVLKQLEELKWI
jgi:hypothetical protein